MNTRDQNLDRQIDALEAARYVRVFAAKKSDGSSDRPELDCVLGFKRPGDTMVVASLDRLSRPPQVPIGLVAEFGHRGVGFRLSHERLGTTSPG
jgi:DNA invertase Pin-like site-specific DNA recombinase